MVVYRDASIIDYWILSIYIICLLVVVVVVACGLVRAMSRKTLINLHLCEGRLVSHDHRLLAIVVVRPICKVVVLIWGCVQTVNLLHYWHLYVEVFIIVVRSGYIILVAFKTINWWMLGMAPWEVRTLRRANHTSKRCLAAPRFEVEVPKVTWWPVGSGTWSNCLHVWSCTHRGSEPSCLDCMEVRD